MDPIVSMVLSVVIVVGLLIIVVPVVYDVIDKGTSMALINHAKTQLASLDSILRELNYEATGAKRSIKMNLKDGYFAVSGKENSIKFIMDNKVNTDDSGVRYKEGNLLVTSGSYVSSYEKDIDNDGDIELVIENSNILFAIEKIGSSSAYSELNTTKIISLIRNKNKNIDSVPISSIKIDNSSSYGNGYTELITTGDSVGTGIIRIVMNSTIDYEVFFKLAHNANWIDMEVRLI